MTVGYISIWTHFHLKFTYFRQMSKRTMAIKLSFQQIMTLLIACDNIIIIIRKTLNHILPYIVLQYKPCHTRKHSRLQTCRLPEDSVQCQTSQMTESKRTLSLIGKRKCDTRRIKSCRSAEHKNRS